MAATAGRQHGIVARWQMLEAGISRQQVERQLARTLHPVRRGVYAVGHPALTPEGRWIAAVLLGGPGSALSHVSAAVLWRMLDSAGATIHVTVPGAGGRKRERDGLILHRSPDVPRAVVNGIPVTTPARTLVDLAAHAPERTVRAAIKGAERQRILDVAAVREAAAHRAGARRLATVLQAWDDAPTKEELEQRFLELCDRHGLPRPEVNAPLLGFTVDFLWRDQRVVVETDGMATHGGVLAAIEDRERDAALTRAGYLNQRFVWRQITRRAEQPATAETVRALLRSGR
ncbi:MAG TPA: DUF559 domain-containing protein [Solirubrobacteraceae bacterium]|nr:DUF559 domain-containing protein [Solirubrobacteraceae bacterium]